MISILLSVVISGMNGGAGDTHHSIVNVNSKSLPISHPCSLFGWYLKRNDDDDDHVSNANLHPMLTMVLLTMCWTRTQTRYLELCHLIHHTYHLISDSTREMGNMMECDLEQVGA